MLRYAAPVGRAIAAFAAVLAIGCDGGSSDEGRMRHGVGRRDPDSLVVGRAADAISLDPARVSDTESVEVVSQLYETLVTYRREAGTLEPRLAERWEVSPDGTAWTFHLRRGVRFHDGTPLDAAAVVFSFERILDPGHPAAGVDPTGQGFDYARSLFQQIAAVEAVGPRAVRITSRGRYAPLAANLAVFAASIVSPTAFGARTPDRYRNPVGTGPFRFVSWKNGLLVLERNPDYWGRPPALERLSFRSLPDGRQRLIALESGSIDVAYSILPDELSFVEMHPDLVLHRAAVSSVAYLAMNTARPPFDDVRVRRAANLAINKEPIVKLAYQGLATPADGPLPPSQWGAARLPRVRYDPTAARALLAEAQRDGRFDPDRTYRFYVSSTPRPYLPAPEEVGRAIRANLAAVGIQTEVIVSDFADHLGAIRRGQHDLCLLGWVGDTGDPDNFLYVLFDPDHTSPGAARNVSFFRDGRLHQLLLAGQRGQTRGERERVYREAQELIADAAPWVPLAHAQVAVAARVDVGGIAVNPLTYVEFQGVRRLGR